MSAQLRHISVFITQKISSCDASIEPQAQCELPLFHINCSKHFENEGFYYTEIVFFIVPYLPLKNLISHVIKFIVDLGDIGAAAELRGRTTEMISLFPFQDQSSFINIQILLPMLI